MPNYEFKCQDCKKKYAITLTIKNREEGRYKCPKCGSGSKKSQPVIGMVYAKTSRKS